MNNCGQNRNVKNRPHHLRYIFIIALLLLITACGATDENPDPVVADFVIGYVKRAIPVDNQGNIEQPDIREPLTFTAGGDLYIRDRASPSAPERNVTYQVTGGMGDVKDVEVSNDGSNFIFALRLPEIEGLDDDEQPTWNIWQYEIETASLTRIIASDIRAEDGQDITPNYLADGRIIFSSTRQRLSKAILLDDGKPQFAALDENQLNPSMVLHVMNNDGSEISQISFNQSNDLDPVVLANGNIVFSRWDNVGTNNDINLYSMAPDGTGLELLYGANSHNTGTDNSMVQFVNPREMANGQIMALLMPFTGTNGGGDIITIDVENYIENTQPTGVNIASLSGNAQVKATVNNVRTDTAPSPGGRFSAAYPLWDGTKRMVVSWTPCRVVVNERMLPCTDELLADPNIIEAPPLYGIFIYNMDDSTQRPIVTPIENISITDVVVAQEKTDPSLINDTLLDPNLTSDGVGVLHIRSVYDIDGVDSAIPNIASLMDPAQTTTADQRPARFLRIVKAVSIPDKDIYNFRDTAFGVSRQQGMREIISYIPIEPDGSVMVKVPANVSLSISILDKNGRRIGPRHQNWLQVRPGETVECNGCHDPNSGLSHGRNDAFIAINQGAPTSGLPFPNSDPTKIANMGETMAQTRARISCAALPLNSCASITPSVDIKYSDVWTDDPTVRAIDPPFDYLYTAYTGDSNYPIPAPTTSSCQTKWTNACRITINYETHIHLLWNKPRNAGIDTCTSCHTTKDNMDKLMVPAAQLDLTDGASSDITDHFKSYRELLLPDDELEIIGGALQPRSIQETDGNGALLFETDENGAFILDANQQRIPVMVAVRAVGPSMSVNGANASYFLPLFDTGGTHVGRLSAAELKLISEWLDIGAQYYNNPFDAPAN